MENKDILQKANALITKEDYEGFLDYCTEDTRWVFVGEQVLNGKDAVRKYMLENYLEPPKFNAEQIIADGDYVTAIGKISIKDQNGKLVDSDYCDVWKFREGKMAELIAFVIPCEKPKTGVAQPVTVRGSGFSYDEDDQPTDERIPADQVPGEDIVELPDLGQPNRP